MRKAVKSNLLLRIWGNEVIMTTNKDTRERGVVSFFNDDGNKKTIPPFPLLNTQRVGSTLMHPTGLRNRVSEGIKNYRVDRQAFSISRNYYSSSIQLYFILSNL